MKIEISRAVAREILGEDRELEIEFTYWGPDALPNCYKWRTPMRPAGARIRCEALRVDYEESTTVETPKRPYGRLGYGHEGYAAIIYGGEQIVRTWCRCGRNDPTTQRAAALVLRHVLEARFRRTVLGQLATTGREAA